MKPALNHFSAGILFALLAGMSLSGQSAMTIPNGPLYVGAAVPPIVMLNITKDQNLYQKAYNDYSDLDSDGYIDLTYKHTIDYYGYFDSYKCYTYSSSRFEPVANSYLSTKPDDCGGQWHGNFLNWASMSRMDAVRKLLYGGLRSTDGTGAAGITVLERTYLPSDAHSWAKYYNPVIAQAMDLKPLSGSETWAQRYPAIIKLTPFNPDTTPTAVTSTSSKTIGTGNRAFAVSSTTAFSYGDQVLIEDAADANNYMVGAVGCVNGTGITMYDGIAAGTSSCAAGEIEVAVEKIGGSGTKASWKIYNWTQTGLTMCNTTLGATSGANMKSQTNTNPPLLRVAKGNFSLWNANERWQCYWREDTTSPAEVTTGIGTVRTNGNRAALSGSYASSLGPNKTTTSSGRIANGANGASSDYNVRIKACVDEASIGKEKCANYPNGNYKPTGLLQYYGETGLLKFGLMTGSYTKNKSGGVLRKNAGALADEINTTTDGTFKTTLPAGGTIINSLNKMRMYGYDYSDGTYKSDGTSGSTFCSWGETSLTEGTCLSWGNPMAEIFVESLRYLAGKSVTAAFNADDSARISGLATATWSDPLSNANYCAPLNVLNFNASASSYDKDQMGGAADIGADAVSKTNTVGSEEGITHGYVGNNGTTNNDICSDKTIGSLGAVYGICPEGAGIEGSYLMSGVAYHAHTNRIRSDLTLVPTGDLKSLKISTYGISLATNVPRITVPVGTGSVTIMPAGRLDQTSVGKGYGGGALVDFKIICQIPAGASTATVDTIRKESGGMCDAAGSGAFYVNWEDSEQGGDYDQDMWGRIKYQVNAGNTITITTDVVAESTNMDFGFGYAVSGTTRDGPHFHSGIEGFSYTDPTPVTVAGDLTHINASGGCNNCAPGDGATSVTYTPLSTTPSVLQDPLSYAAKYGGFKDNCTPVDAHCDNNHQPNIVDEWDIKKADGTAGSDGIPDNFFQVTNPNALEMSLDQAFRSMLNESSASSVATNSTSLQTGSRIYQARFNSNYWYGELRALDLDENTGDITGEAWNAKTVINSQASGSRVIITYGIDTEDGIPFRWTDISTQTDTTQKDWLNKNELGVTDSKGDLRVDYLRGSATNEGKSAVDFRERPESKLGDIVNSSPTYVGVPNAGWPGSTYSAFITAKASRTPIIYAGSNDGMLHGFDAADGKEKIAYVPSVVYSNLSKLTGQSYSHKYFVDGTPMVNDIEVGPGATAVWKTVLVGGLNWGGRAYYALDVTDPSSFSEGNAADLVMWEFTNANDVDLGYTHVQPTYPAFKGIAQQIRPMYNGKWAAIVGNGYNSDNGKAALFIFFIDHSGATWTAGTDYIKLVADVGPDNGLSTPTPYDLDDDGIVDVIYAGDLKGNLWRFDVSSATPASWTVALAGQPLFVAKDASGNRQPITTAPRVMRHSLGGTMVLFGTGKYLENTDTTTPFSQQTQYGIWDKDGASSVTGRTDLVQQTVDSTTSASGNEYRITSKNFNDPTDWATKRGWYMDFPNSATTGERVSYNGLLRNDRIVFPTLIPSDTPCLAGGSSWLMELDALTGNRLEISPFDVNNDGIFDQYDLITVGSIDVAVGGVKPAEGGIITTPTVIKDKNQSGKEYKYASSSTGAVIKTPESASPGQTGRTTWREILE